MMPAESDPAAASKSGPETQPTGHDEIVHGLLADLGKRGREERGQDQRSLYEQVSDLWRFAREQKMYDAQDWLATQWSGRPLPWSLSERGSSDA